jgi:hypothetical protein
MFDWLVYSEVKDVASCLPCFIFAKRQQGGLEAVHLLLKDFIIGRKLMIVCIVLF